MFQADGVERLAAGLGVHPSGHLVEAQEGQGQGVDERLRHGLDGERHPGVARAVAVTVHADQGQPEGARVGERQLRNVVGEFALVDIGKPGVQFSQRVRDRTGGGAHRAPGRQPRSAWAIRGNDLTPAALRLLACWLTVRLGGASAKPSTTESSTLPEASTNSTRTA